MAIRIPKIAICIAVLVAAPVAQAAQISHADGAAKFVSALAERAMSTLAESKLASGDRRERFRELFNDAFAVEGIGKFVLGRHWRKATPEERQEYLVLFEDQIVGTWADRFTEYSGNKFEIMGAAEAKGLRAPVALVETKFWTGPKTSLRVDWRVSTADSNYKITDIYVEGVSLANTHRSEYSSAIRRHGGTVEGLLQAMRNRRDGIILPTLR